MQRDLDSERYGLFSSVVGQMEFVPETKLRPELACCSLR